MKFPVNRQWRVVHNTDIGLNLFGTKNISFDDDGVATLSERVVTLFNTANDSDIDVPLATYFNGTDITTVVTADEVFDVNIDVSVPTITQTNPAFGDVPSPDSVNSDAVFFNNEWVLTEDTEICTFSASATSPWTRRTLSPALSNVGILGNMHPVTVNLANNSLCIGNRYGVAQINTSWATGTLPQLTLPSGFEVTAIAYNRNLVGIVTWSERNDEAYFFIWDAGATSANYAYPIGSNRGYFVAPYKDTFLVLTGKGQLLSWASTGMMQVGALPSFYTTAILGDVDDRADITTHSSYYVDGDVLLFNISSVCKQQGSEPQNYIQTQPSGVWCYDPVIGLYHRYAPSAPKLLAQTVATSAVNITDNIITTTVTVPETGTEVVYTKGAGGDAIGGLTTKTKYYVIRLTDSTLKLATTRANAIAGTTIDITSTGNNTQALQFFPAWDYGQASADGVAGIVAPIGSVVNEQTASSYIFGARNLGTVSLSDTDNICVTSQYADNRGWIVTQKILSPNVTDLWSKLYVKARGLKKDGDEIIVKHRTTEDPDAPIYVYGSSNYVTWVDSNTFTTTVDLTNVQVGYEVEFIAGAGAGYLAHVTSLAYDTGTWTVNIDEDIRNIASGNRSYCIFDNWFKLGTTMTASSDKNYTEFSIGKSSKSIQFKFELRGKDVALEEFELINSPYKKAV